MLVKDETRMKILAEARDEYAGSHREVPGRSFYEPRIRTSWERARSSKAYSGLGRFAFSEFERLPITTKEELKAAPLDYTTIPLTDSQKYYETTGTTGSPTPTPRLAEDVIWNVVSVAEAWRDVLQPDDRVAILLPSDVVPVADLVVGVCEYLDVAHVRAYPFATGVADWDRVVEIWRQFAPTVVFLAPGVALHATRLSKSRGEMGSMRDSVRALMLLGEVSTPPFRERLGQWWEATAYDASYGSTETGTLAATCAHGRQHLLPSATYFELTDGTTTWPVNGPGEGRLVVTPLHLHARPLLRLDTGDQVRLDTSCRCGSAVPTVEVLGRTAEVVTVRGVPLSVHGVETAVFSSAAATSYLLEVDEDAREVRLLLERDVDADRADEDRLAERVQQASESELGLRWNEVVWVNSLPAVTKSGASQKSWKRSNVRVVGGTR